MESWRKIECAQAIQRIHVWFIRNLRPGYDHKSYYTFSIIEDVYSFHLSNIRLPLSVSMLSLLSTAILHSNCRAHVQSALGHRCRPIAALAAAAAGWRPSTSMFDSPRHKLGLLAFPATVPVWSQCVSYGLEIKTALETLINIPAMS